jgi:WD40 repeat protein
MVNKKERIVSIISFSCLFCFCLSSKGLDCCGQPSDLLVNRGLGLMSESAIPTLISNASQVSGVIEISTPGYYKVIEHLIYPIIISSDRVVLNLNDYRVSSSDSSVNLITVQPYRQRIFIYNGYLHNTGSAGGGGCGLVIGFGASHISCQDLMIFQSDYGVFVTGIPGDTVTDCQLQGVYCIGTITGFQFTFATTVLVQNCHAENCTQAGFSLFYSATNCFKNCCAVRVQGPASTAGFFSAYGQGNLFQACVVKQTKTSSTTFGDKACGFLLTGTEQKTKIIDCIVNETDVVNTHTAVTFGIDLAPIIQPMDDLLSTVTLWTNQGSSAYGCAWSPNNDYLAVTTRALTRAVRIYKFNGTTLTLAASVNLAAQAAGVAWSPDGNYLAVGAGTYASPNVYVYTFNGQVLTNVATFAGAGGLVYSLAWSPNGKYLAYADCEATGYVRTLNFNGSSLTQVSSLSLSNSIGVTITLSWAPDGSAIAVSQNYNAQPLRVIPVNASGQMGAATTLATSAQWSGMKWSPHGRYFATCDGTNNAVRVYRWNPTEVSPIVQVASMTGESIGYNAVTWSPDGNYIVASTSSDTVRLYQFSGTSLTFIKESVALNNTINTLAWSADGRYIAACSQAAASQYMVLTAMYGPLNCLIDNCRVCDTLASSQNMGVGLAMGGSNVCTQNNACNNGANYSYGISNVYHGLFEVTRDTVQQACNISEPTTR